MEGARKIGSGNSNSPLPVEHKNEFDQLAIILNQMVRNIRELKAARAELENEIKERMTAEQELGKMHEELNILVKTPTDALEKTNTELSIALQEKKTVIKEIHHRTKTTWPLFGVYCDCSQGESGQKGPGKLYWRAIIASAQCRQFMRRSTKPIAV